MPENDKGVFWYEDEQRRKPTVHPLLQCDVGTDEKVRRSRKRAEEATGKGQLRDDFYFVSHFFLRSAGLHGMIAS